MMDKIMKIIIISNYLRKTNDIEDIIGEMPLSKFQRAILRTKSSIDRVKEAIDGKPLRRQIIMTMEVFKYRSED